MQETLLLPAIVFEPMAGALITWLIGRRSKKARNFAALAVAAAELLLIIRMITLVCGGTALSCALPALLGGIRFEADGFRGTYACVAGVMWLFTTLFSQEYLRHYRNRNRYWFFTLMTAGATAGVFLASDLLTAFIFFEIMSFTSYVMVVHDENAPAMRAGQTYLAVAVLGGMVMLMGLFLLFRQAGTLAVSELRAACAAVPEGERGNLYLAGALILFGYGAKAGMFPLHIWLPKAHPAAPAPASALLSGILTKAGVFGVLVLSARVFCHDGSWGTAMLVLGEMTMVTGAVLAVFSVNLKRTLACSSVSQIGFILTGIGMQGLLGEENALAVWGTELHMINHSLFKLVLFMCAGAIYMNTHRLDMNDIRGFGRGKPALMITFLVGCLGIGGVPLFSGYISKTLLHEGIVEYAEVLAHAGAGTAAVRCAEWIFLLSGGMTVAYMAKLFIALFVEKNADPAVQARYDGMNGKYMNGASMAALMIPMALLPVMGSFPSATMQRIAELGQAFMNGESPEHAIAWFSWTNLKGAAISLAIGAVLYFGVIRPLLMRKDGENRVYVNRWPSRLDLEDSVYRPLCRVISRGLTAACRAVNDFGSRILPAVARFIVMMPGRAKLGNLIDTLGSRWIPAALHFVTVRGARIISAIPDFATGIINRTILRRIPMPKDSPEDHEPDDLSVEVRVPDQTVGILNSFSYGLILFGIGLVGLVLYLILK